MLKATVIYSTSPLIEDHKFLLDCEVSGVIPGLYKIAETLNKPGVIDKMPDDWLQLTVTLVREK